MKTFIAFDVKNKVSEAEGRKILENIKRGDYSDSNIKTMTIYRTTSDNMTIERLREEFKSVRMK